MYVLDALDAYNKRLVKRIDVHKTHAGYFSIDKKGRKVDSTTKRGSDESDDISAYDLILKDKEKLLSFDNPVRFIFSLFTRRNSKHSGTISTTSMHTPWSSTVRS